MKQRYETPVVERREKLTTIVAISTSGVGKT
jgi:hypothetical protein